jgi:hypothetical protein
MARAMVLFERQADGSWLPATVIDPGPYASELLFAWAPVERMRELISRP